jgi:hypothetical protein
LRSTAARIRAPEPCGACWKASCAFAPVRYIVRHHNAKEGAMSHGVHAVQHEAEHKIKHEDGGHSAPGLDSRNKKIALVIAILALFLAFSETLGKSAQTNAISYNVEASNLWAFYQAKTIRQTAMQVGTELLKAERMKLDGEGGKDALLKGLDERIDGWVKTVARYESEPRQREVRKAVNLDPPYGEGRRELAALALAAERKRDTSMERYHHYEVASAALQIGIVLASSAVITGMMALTWLAGGLGLVGLGFMGIGLFAPHAVHLF